MSATECEEIQEKLYDLYWETFSKYKGGLGFSIPLMPRITKNYLKNRVIVVGQETNTWYRKTEDDLFNLFTQNRNYIENLCLVERYDNFTSYVSQDYKGKFWGFNRSLYENNFLQGPMVTGEGLSHCWLNLFCVEACKDKGDKTGCPSNSKGRHLVKPIIKLQGELLYQLFDLLKPKLILFLVGNSVNTALNELALGNPKSQEWIPLDNQGVLLGNDDLCEIKINDEENILKDVNILKAYHPTYFLGRINSNDRIKQNLNDNNLETSPSEYYSNLLFEYLKKT